MPIGTADTLSPYLSSQPTLLVIGTSKRVLLRYRSRCQKGSKMPQEVEIQPVTQPERLVIKTERPVKNLGVGDSLWESVAGEWVLLKCGCASGFEPGSPPIEPGAYEGQILRKLCEPIAS
jgi:hypothetical protein